MLRHFRVTRNALWLGDDQAEAYAAWLMGGAQLDTPNQRNAEVAASLAAFGLRLADD